MLSYKFQWNCYLEGMLEVNAYSLGLLPEMLVCGYLTFSQPLRVFMCGLGCKSSIKYAATYIRFYKLFSKKSKSTWYIQTQLQKIFNITSGTMWFESCHNYWSMSKDKRTWIHLWMKENTYKTDFANSKKLKFMQFNNKPLVLKRFKQFICKVTFREICK